MWKRKNPDSSKINPRKATSASIETLRAKASAYCALAEHCPHEVKLKLKQWGADAVQSDELIDWLEDQNFISEQRYCAAFVADKIRFQGWGKMKIRTALLQKQLPKQLITDALAAFPEEEYRSRIADIVAHKSRLLQADNPQQFKQKLLRFLASRGFAYADIAAALSDLDFDPADYSYALENLSDDE